MELFDDKILIAGGSTSGSDKGGLSNVEIYDISKNQCKEMAPLPSVLMDMATVGWKSNMILVGGADDEGVVTNAVIAYDFETGKSKALPSMEREREGATAVVFENTIVVMGGMNEERKCVDSVESFNFLLNSWKELPSMIEPRAWATACFVKSEDFERL